MFRILCDPSSGSTELCLTEITRSGSHILSCAWSVFGSAIFEPVVCVCVCVCVCVLCDGLRTTVNHSE